jgi:hypothetical protein
VEVVPVSFRVTPVIADVTWFVLEVIGTPSTVRLASLPATFVKLSPVGADSTETLAELPEAVEVRESLEPLESVMTEAVTPRSCLLIYAAALLKVVVSELLESAGILMVCADPLPIWITSAPDEIVSELSSFE